MDSSFEKIEGENKLPQKILDCVEMELLELREEGKTKEDVESFKINILDFIQNKIERNVIEQISQFSSNEIDLFIFTTYGKKIEKVSEDHLERFLVYRSVFGYDNSEVLERKKENPLPTTQEVLMGCYREQIEKQTREALLVVRNKGYETVQSGFYDWISSSQFFDILDQNGQLVSVLANVFEEIKAFENKNNIHFELIDFRERKVKRDKVYLILNSTNGYKNLEDWNEFLIEFAELLPDLGKPAGFSKKGETVEFAFKTIQNYPIEEVLKTASEDEAVLIKKLYECKTEEDIKALVLGVN